MRLPKEQVHRPMHKLLRLLPQVRLAQNGEIDRQATPREILEELADSAYDAAAALHRGFSAIGSLMAYAAPEIEDGTIGADTVESIAWLLSELGELGTSCFLIATQCQVPPRNLAQEARKGSRG